MNITPEFPYAVIDAHTLDIIALFRTYEHAKAYCDDISEDSDRSFAFTVRHISDWS